MTTAKVHARNLAANWLAHGATLVVMFFLSPFIVHALGKVEYGIWSLLTVLTGYMGVLDLGVRASTGRHIVLYLGREDYDAVDQTIRTSLGFFSGLGAVVVVAGGLVGWVFPSCFQRVPEEYFLITQLLLPLMALNVWFSALQGIFSSVLIAHDRFDLTRGVDLGALAVQTVGTVAVLWSGQGIVGLAIVAVGCHVLGLAANFLLARRVYPPLRVWPLLLDRRRLRELFGYGLAASVSMISLKIIGQTDLVVVGAAVSVAAVTVYSVGAMLVYYTGTFLSHINWTFFPPIQRAVARNETESARWLFLRAGRLGLICGLLVYVGLMTFSEPFVRLWMHGPEFGDESVRQAAIVMTILACSKLPLLFVGASVTVLNSIGHVRLTALLTLAEALLNLVLSLLFVLAFGWGLAGIAIGTLVARLAVGTFFAPWYACAKTGTNWWRYVAQVGGLEVLAGSLFAGLCLLIRWRWEADRWLIFFVQVALATAGYAVIALWLLVPATDRRRIWSRIPGCQVLTSTRS